MSKLVWFAVLASAAMACSAGPRRPSPQSWTARGDRAPDPGRALANYEQARRNGDRSRDLASKISLASVQWIMRELANRRAHPVDARSDLAFVAAARARAFELGVEEPVAVALSAAEMAAGQALWSAELAGLAAEPGTPVEELAHLAAVGAVLPALMAPTAEAELTARRTRIIAAQEEALAGSTHPAGRALHAALLDAHHGRAPANHAAIAEPLRVSLEVTTHGCDGFARLAKASTRAAHHVAIHVDGTCAASQSSSSRSQRETWTDIETETYTEHERSRVCSAPAVCGCVDREPSNGVCKRYVSCDQTCTSVSTPVTKTREKRIPRSQSYTIKERKLVANVRGTLTIIVDGVEQHRPFDVPTVVHEQEYTAHASSQAFSGRTPDDVLAELIGSHLGSEIEDTRDQAQRAVYAAHLARAEARLAAGDLRGAEAEVAPVVLGSAHPISPSMTPLAMRAGMPLTTWVQTLRTGKLVIETTFALPAASLELPQPDGDLLKVQKNAHAHADRRARQRGTEDYFARMLDNRSSLIGIGVDRWTALDDTSSHGLALTYGRTRGGGGLGRFWLSEQAYALELNFGAGLGFDGHVRLGAGLRQPWFALAPYALAGVSRRASLITGDPGLPWSVDAGYGAQLVLGPSKSRRLEFLAERLLRPFVDDEVEVQHRQRYELRYVKRHFVGDASGGVRGWCAFDQVTTAGSMVAGERATRTCAVSVFVAY